MILPKSERKADGGADILDTAVGTRTAAGSRDWS